MLSNDNALERYRDLHKWMIFVMVLMQLGIFWDYWGDFTENAWSIHIHYVVATLWYLIPDSSTLLRHSGTNASTPDERRHRDVSRWRRLTDRPQLDVPRYRTCQFVSQESRELRSVRAVVLLRNLRR